MSEYILAETVREHRNALGFSQKQLADALGVRQAIVSRWENLLEPIPKKRQFQLIDLFRNQHGELNPFIDRMCRRSHDISVCLPTKIYVRVSKVFSQAFQINPAEANGTSSYNWAKSNPDLVPKHSTRNWPPTVPKQFLYVEEEVEAFGRDGLLEPPHLRGHVRTFVVRLDKYDSIVLTQTRILGPARGAVGIVHKAIPLSLLDV